MSDNNIKIDPNAVNNSSVQDAVKQLDNLLVETKMVNHDIYETNKEANEGLSEIDREVNKSIDNINQYCAGLDNADAQAGDALDKIILVQAEEVVGE